MNDSQNLRMLLSHNFDINDETVPVLSREAFTQVFIDGFSTIPEVNCRLVNNPHWILEVVTPANFLTPKELGEKCAHILAASRGSVNFDILILGGIKTTPATSNSPDALQANQWGVDVVETKSGEQFLRSINWAGTIATKTSDSIFSIELISG